MTLLTEMLFFDNSSAFLLLHPALYISFLLRAFPCAYLSLSLSPVSVSLYFYIDSAFVWRRFAFVFGFIFVGFGFDFQFLLILTRRSTKRDHQARCAPTLFVCRLCLSPPPSSTLFHNCAESGNKSNQMERHKSRATPTDGFCGTTNKTRFLIIKLLFISFVLLLVFFYAYF